MILSGLEIQRLQSEPDEAVQRIRIDPFDPACCGPNSYDIHLGDTLVNYVRELGQVLDPRKDNTTFAFQIAESGTVIFPGKLYLGHTIETIESHGLVPWIDGRSSVGRLGISVHVTAGRGDDGFAGQYTLEITCVEPVKLYAGMRIGQVTFMDLRGERSPYQGRYQGQTGPTSSRYHQG